MALVAQVAELAGVPGQGLVAELAGVPANWAGILDFSIKVNRTSLMSFMVKAGVNSSVRKNLTSHTLLFSPETND